MFVAENLALSGLFLAVSTLDKNRASATQQTALLRGPLGDD
jgi:hypothetical protein